MSASGQQPPEKAFGLPQNQCVRSDFGNPLSVVTSQASTANETPNPSGQNLTAVELSKDKIGLYAADSAKGDHLVMSPRSIIRASAVLHQLRDLDNTKKSFPPRPPLLPLNLLCAPSRLPQLSTTPELSPLSSGANSPYPSPRGAFIEDDLSESKAPVMTSTDRKPVSVQSSPGDSFRSSLSRTPSPGHPPTKNAFQKDSARLDPTKVPRYPQPVDEPYVFDSRSLTNAVVPPPVNDAYVVVDTGNCSPRHVRATTCAPPTTKSLLTRIGVPFSLIVTPFADVHLLAGETCVPIVDHGDAPQRCAHCQAFINPNVKWINDGTLWQCNLCSEKTIVPSWYYAPVDSSGVRSDRLERPELYRSSADFLLRDDSSEGLCSVFAVDTSIFSLTSGATAASLRAIRDSILTWSTNIDQSRVGIFTFDTKVTFYQVNEKSRNPLRTFIVDCEDPTAALPAVSWILPLRSHTSTLMFLLDSLVDIVSRKLADISRAPPGVAAKMDSDIEAESLSCPMAAIRAAQDALSGTGGGNVFVFTCSHSKVGVGKVRSREKASMYGNDQERSLYSRPSLAFKSEVDVSAISSTLDIARSCHVSSVCVSTFLFSHGGKFKDVSLVSEPSLVSGGKFYFVPGSMAVEENIDRLKRLVHNTLSEFCALRTNVVVRASRGAKAQSFCTAGCEDGDRVVCAGMFKSSTFSCDLTLTDELKDGELLHIQIEVEYTSPFGRRAVRVHNLTLPCASKASAVVANIDSDALVACLVMKTVNRMLCGSHRTSSFASSLLGSSAAASGGSAVSSSSSPSPATTAAPLSPRSAPSSPRSSSIQSPRSTALLPSTLYASLSPREWLDGVLVGILRSYRSHCSPNSPRCQFVLPESMKYVPYCLSSFFKHPAMSENSVATRFLTRASDKAWSLRRIGFSSAQRIISELCPRLEAVDMTKRFQTGQLTFPPMMMDVPAFSPLPSPTVSPPPTSCFSSESSDSGDTNAVTKLSLERFGSPRVPSSSASSDSSQGRRSSSAIISRSSLQSKGIYVLNGPGVVWVWVGGDVPRHDLEQWFCFNGPDKSRDISINKNSDRGCRLLAIVNKLLAAGGHTAEMRVVWPDSKDLMVFEAALCEDSSNGEVSYIDFLCQIHTRINS